MRLKELFDAQMEYFGEVFEKTEWPYW
ncbi:predicted coding region AF_0126 [Archaeoglobus fulgidus DSM 4304]|uniref:Uncharacterized protein AF_0126 n=1 Tax=Archaeoglobus fulgidus (strain ATCC 49558 / DSM 4304 / JCM 9628 / NBRC 100126 / VC-16) TaxID=224325 RepID=Y126_ARCFU|nr:RecName: Full=Uncharacterized protein AF_0126 [Archaeoglobus fulgidus DSM 4304]AAB91107.1 predicted coding region AF_0126 [Archaeoglobus fulgidus DSM 4304]